MTAPQTYNPDFQESDVTATANAVTLGGELTEEAYSMLVDYTRVNLSIGEELNFNIFGLGNNSNY